MHEGFERVTSKRVLNSNIDCDVETSTQGWLMRWNTCFT